jgi:hypothetical protein
MAEFLTVYPAVQKDLSELLPEINAKTDSGTIDKAAKAIKAFNQMVGRVVEQAEREGLQVQVTRRTRGTAATSCQLTIEEHMQDVSGISALVVTIRKDGPFPSDIGQPSLTISGYQTQPLPADTETGAYSYYFVDQATRKPLEAAAGQAIPKRTLVLPKMPILQYQDAWSSVYLTRNDTLDQEAIADEFVYTTPEVQFANPCYPVNRSDQPVDIATIGTNGQPQTRSLHDHLDQLFAALFSGTNALDIAIQLNVEYGYPVNQHLSNVQLPVLLQPPQILGKGHTAEMIVSDIANAIMLWAQQNNPATSAGQFSNDDGMLTFSITIMSSLTSRPMPLLMLTNLFLRVKYIGAESV